MKSLTQLTADLGLVGKTGSKPRRNLPARQEFVRRIEVPVHQMGSFYVVQIVPDLDPHRIKLGFSGDVSNRLAVYRTRCPAAQVLRTWPCKLSWEKAAIDSVTRVGCKAIANSEVFVCPNIDALIERVDEFFQILPVIG